MKRLKIWLLKILFTKDEKYLLERAIEDRVENLWSIYANEKWADRNNIATDCADYLKLKTIFSTKDYR